MTDSSGKKPSARGRPKLLGEDLFRRQQKVMRAIRQLMQQNPTFELNVRDVVAASKTSTPTFYRWFPGGIEQAMDMLILEAREKLTNELLKVAKDPNMELCERVAAAVWVYFDWCKQQGPVATAFYREGMSEQGLAYKYRKETVQSTVALCNQLKEFAGIPNLSASSIEVLVSWVESAASVVYRRHPVVTEDADQHRDMTVFVVLDALMKHQAAFQAGEPVKWTLPDFEPHHTPKP